MGSSVSQALIIVAGVIIAMLVMAFVNQTFIQTGKWASTQDQEQKIEQVQKFNQEWEVYDKKLMYGVDVISCLNKALSNNDKINNGTIVNGEKYDKSYAATISVEIKSDLQESITVYYIKQGDKEHKEMQATEDWFSGYKLDDMKKKFSFKNGTQFKITDDLKTSVIPSSKMKEGIYQLTWDKTGDNEENLREQLDLLKYRALEETVINSGENMECKSYETVNGVKQLDGKIWTKAIYRSVLYDLKNRKFTCTGITYKADSGRVDTITFKEL